MDLRRTFYKLVGGDSEKSARPCAPDLKDACAPELVVAPQELVTEPEIAPAPIQPASMRPARATPNCKIRSSAMPPMTLAYAGSGLQMMLASDSRWASMGAGAAFSQSVVMHALGLCLLSVLTINAQHYTHLADMHCIDFELMQTPGAVNKEMQSLRHSSSTDGLSAKADSLKDSKKLFDLETAMGVKHAPARLENPGKRTLSLHTQKQAPISNRIINPLKQTDPKSVQSAERDQYAVGKADPFAYLANHAKKRGAFTIPQTLANEQTTRQTDLESDLSTQPLTIANSSSPEQAKVTSAPYATPSNLTKADAEGAPYVGSQMVQDNAPRADAISEVGNPRLGLENGWLEGQPDFAQSSAARSSVADAPGSFSYLRLKWSATMHHPIFLGGDPSVTQRLNSSWTTFGSLGMHNLGVYSFDGAAGFVPPGPVWINDHD